MCVVLSERGGQEMVEEKENVMTTAKNPDQGRELLRFFGMPFREHSKQDR